MAKRTKGPKRTGRKRRRKAKTISERKLSKEEIVLSREIVEEIEALRPKTRGECVNGPRPCPFVSCKYHLYLDVNPKNGAIKLNFPDLEVWELPITCALDVADLAEDKGYTLEAIGSIMNLTRERIRQMEAAIIKKLRELLVDDFKNKDKDEE